MNIAEKAKEARGNWQRFDSFAWHHKPEDAEEYALVYTSNRDSTLVDQSNAQQIEEALAPFDDVIPERHSHWAVGHVDGYAIRVYRDGAITEAFKTYCGLMERLEDYPLLNEEDYYKREEIATIENIQAHSANWDGAYVLPDDYAENTFTWLCDNNQNAIENRDDTGGYPSSADLRDAWDDLGYRIMYIVRWNDAGEHTEEYPDESSAEARATELKQFHATYEVQ